MHEYLNLDVLTDAEVQTVTCKRREISPHSELMKLVRNHIKVAERCILPAASRWSDSDLWGKSPAGLWGSAPPRTLRPAAPLQRRRRAASMRRAAPRWAAWSSAWSRCATACGPLRVSNSRWLAPNTFLSDSCHLLAPPYPLIFFSFCHA